MVFPKWTAHGVADWNELLVEDDDGQFDLNNATAALLNYMPAIGITALTDETAEDAWCRIAIHQTLFGGLVHDSTSEKTFFLTKADVFRHIGIEAEGTPRTFGEFCESLLRRAQREDASESLFLLLNGGQSLLEICGVPAATD